jgi:hypothetical protein
LIPIASKEDLNTTNSSSVSQNLSDQQIDDSSQATTDELIESIEESLINRKFLSSLSKLTKKLSLSCMKKED